MKHIKPLHESWDDPSDYDEYHDRDKEPWRRRDLGQSEKLFKCLGLTSSYAVLWRKPHRDDLWLLDLEGLEGELEEYIYRFDAEKIWEIEPEMAEDLATDLWTGDNPDLPKRTREEVTGEGVKDSLFGDNPEQAKPLVKMDAELADLVIEDLLLYRAATRRPTGAMGDFRNLEKASEKKALADAIGRVFPPEG